MDKDGYSPLHLAVANGHYSSVLVLLQLGAKVTLKNRWVGGADHIIIIHIHIHMCYPNKGPMIFVLY